MFNGGIGPGLSSGLGLIWGSFLPSWFKVDVLAFVLLFAGLVRGLMDDSYYYIHV